MRTIPIALLVLAAACAGERAPIIPLGEARLAVPGGAIWYNVSGTDSALPLVLLHGGPGFSSVYLKPLEAVGTERLIVRYDQLGGGHSDTTTDTTLMNAAHFVAELDSLRAHLGIEQWHVLGHSWGTILALEYWRAHPDRVASITFGSPVFDVPAFERHARQLLTTLPDSSQRAVRRGEAAHRYDDPSYVNAMNQFYARYVFRHPVQPDLDSLFASANMAIYNYMQGPSEFTITGTLKTYDATPALPLIGVPVLVTVGEFDEVGPELVREHAARIPGARFHILPGAAHLTTWDAPAENIRVVREFLRAADSTATAARR